MRLSEFILANLEEIIGEWIAFARTKLPEKHLDDAALRDDAAGILTTIAREMEKDQSEFQQTAKSQGLASRPQEDTSAETHSLNRLGHGFNQVQVISEFRALRATVIRLWLNSSPELDDTSMYQLTRFNEGIDQAVCESAVRFMKKIEESTDFAVAVLAHDLRNPLNAIMSAAQLFEATTSIDRATLTKIAGHILESGKQMTRLINNLLDFTRTRLGQALPVKREPIDLGTICRKGIAEIAAAHPDRTIQLSCPARLLAHGDGTRISQMVSNLVANAIHHGDPRTPVTVITDLLDGPSDVLRYQGMKLTAEDFVAHVCANKILAFMPDPHKNQRRQIRAELGLDQCAQLAPDPFLIVCPERRPPVYAVRDFQN